ncbi:MAG: hypothetical protein DI587_36780 [Variovorax paradoxus]|nr:MAG: hypothetical protein DI583_36780 [Variovorax paradoxus]PZQ00471.1 MAG: hypothetical protein DI587_36780 [Variovorax paradoxus]
MSRTRIALLTFAGLLAVGAQVQAANDAPLTREQVRAEYFKARAEGTLPPSGEVGYVNTVGASKSTLTRAEVLRELAASGPVQTGEGADLGYMRPTGSARSRADVHAEAVEAVRSGVRTGGEL